MLSILAAAAVLFQASAAAAPPAPRVSVITQPDWLRRPAGEDLTRLYPKAALAKRLEGFATIQCHVTAAGDLADCRTIDEAPLGEGFGEAAVAMAATFKMRPMAKDGAPVSGGTVRIPIRFKLPAPPIPPTPMVMRCYGYAAAAAERNPASRPIQISLATWRLLLEVKSLPEGQRPSEFEATLLSLRKTGAEHLGSVQYKAERDECSGFETANPAMMRDMASIGR